MRGGTRRDVMTQIVAWLLASALTLVTSEAECATSAAVVATSSGSVRGRIVPDVYGNASLSVFLGVQYGEAPVGDARFKPSRPAPAWSGVRDALAYGNSCYQWRDFSFEHYQRGFHGTKMWNPNTDTSEDCLYLNVWTPRTNDLYDGELLPVMVWVYGGGYYSGTSSLDVYNGQWLAATQNVVVVSMNYRVAALGFLALDDDQIPGNAGLYDQRLALKWVRDNIVAFGGDPARVTLFGESAGAASISIHLMSPKSAGLFRSVILQSGTVLSPWSLLAKDEGKRRAINLADKLNCTTDDAATEKYNSTANATTTSKVGESPEQRRHRAMVECLRRVDAQLLVDTEIALEDYGTFRFSNAPVLSADFVALDPKRDAGGFVNRDVDVMAGYNLNEGNYFLVYGSSGFDLKSGSKIDRRHFDAGVRRALKNPLGDRAQSPLLDIMTENVGFAYTRGLRPGARVDGVGCASTVDDDVSCAPAPASHSCRAGRDTFYRDRLDDAVGDVSVVCPILQTVARVTDASAAAERGVYMYLFAHRSSQNPWPKWMGVMHGYEIEFVFGLPLDPRRGYSNREKHLAKHVMKLWGNFAKHRNPNGRKSKQRGDAWTEYDARGKCVKVLGGYHPTNRTSSMASYNEARFERQLSRCAFWNEVFPRLHKLTANAMGSRLAKAVKGGALSAMRVVTPLVAMLAAGAISRSCCCCC